MLMMTRQMICQKSLDNFLTKGCFSPIIAGFLKGNMKNHFLQMERNMKNHFLWKYEKSLFTNGKNEDKNKS